MDDMREVIARSRKVALYKSMDSDYYMVDEVKFVSFDEHLRPLPEGKTRERVMKGYVRVSEPVEVALSPLSDDTVIQGAIASLDEAEREALRELNQKIASIRAQKAQLLAITHQP